MPGDTQYTLDTLLQLKDAGAITADAAAQVGGAAKVIDLGSNALVNGVVMIDVSALDLVTGDEGYMVQLQGSSSSTFASDVNNLATLNLGGATSIFASAASASTLAAATRFIVPFRNEKGGVRYRYLRAYTDVNGTTPSINYVAHLAVQKAAA